jgi:hypothetical protein
MPNKIFMQINNNEKQFKKNLYNSYKHNLVHILPKTNVNMSLNAPMINRVHNVRSGCSACGKKVM